jgi:transposase, IS6 family
MSAKRSSERGRRGQVIDMLVSCRRDIAAARRFFTTALTAHGRPDEVVTDLAHALAHVIEELLPNTLHNTAQYANSRVESDHGRLKARPRPMRGLKRDRTASVVIRGHAFIENIRRGHHEIGADARNHHLRAAAAFDEVRRAI